MAMTNSPRFGSGLQKYGNGTDPWIGRAGWNAFADMFEALVAQATQGLASARPATGVVRQLYWATDTKIMSWYTGTAWEIISPTGGFGVPPIFSVAGTEGIDARSARGDHRHPSPLIYAASLGSFSSTGASVPVVSTGAVPLLGAGTHRIEVRASGSFVVGSGASGSAQLTCTGSTSQAWKATAAAPGLAGEGSDYGGARYFTTVATSVSLNFQWQRTTGNNTAFTDPTVLQIFDWGLV